jgi:short subunit dehydrogenase-like uncharacterized protein
MGTNILLYGATGYSGRLIAAEAKRHNLTRDGAANCRVILAARDAHALREVATKNRMEHRVFGLDDTSEIVQRLGDVRVVLNAAGPFAFTAERLAGAAIRAGCHYVDINGELDVYRKLDDLALKAWNRKIALVSGAGAWAGTSDVLLSRALEQLGMKARKESDGAKPPEQADGAQAVTKLDSAQAPKELDEVRALGAVRIALSQVLDFSRGSAASAARMLREQVLVVRARVVRESEKTGGPGGSKNRLRKMVSVHEPIGKIERVFHFGPLPARHDRLAQGGRRIASAANMIDTLSAKHTAARYNAIPERIETYVLTGPVGRFAYDFAGMTSSILTCPYVRGFTQAQMKSLPEGPTQEEQANGRHVVVLEIEDELHTRVIDWCLQTPDVYQLTAQIAVATARNMAGNGFEARGWATPAQALGSTKIEGTDAFKGCEFLRKGAA